MKKSLAFAIFDILISLMFVSAFFYFWPTDLIYDDGGILLKYMDNFAQGYFYSYNPADGPVFGISGFVHGIVAGSLAYLHIFSPLNSLFASNYLGLFLTSLFSLKILSHYVKNPLVIYPAWLLLMSSSPHFIITTKQGLETPLHLAIILLCFLLFLYKRTPWMWLCFVLAVISKLDAVPIVSILSLLVALQMRASSKQEIARHAKQILFYGVIPIILWILFTYLVFDGPLPQTAFSKLYFRGHPSDHWFPFFHTWLAQMGKTFFALFFLTFFGYFLYAFLLKKQSSLVTVLPFGFSVFGCLGLYFYYNPAEQMSWYYAAPEFLILLQVIVVILVVTDLSSLQILTILKERFSREEGREQTLNLKLSSRHMALIALCGFVAIGFVCVPRAISWAKSTVWWISMVESERIATGQWIRQHSSPDDTLLAWHGHIARESHLYTIDGSGLNSKIVTDYKNTTNQIIAIFKPDWIAQHGLIPAWMQTQEHYTLRKSFYNISGKVDYATWRIYKKGGTENTETAIAISKEMIRTDGSINPRSGYLIIDGSQVNFDGFTFMPSLTKLIVGLVKKTYPISIKAYVYGVDRSLLKEEHILLEVENPGDLVNGYTQEWEIELNPEWQVDRIMITSQIASSDKPPRITLVDPIYLQQIAEPGDCPQIQGIDP